MIITSKIRRARKNSLGGAFHGNCHHFSGNVRDEKWMLLHLCMRCKRCQVIGGLAGNRDDFLFSNCWWQKKKCQGHSFKRISDLFVVIGNFDV